MTMIQTLRILIKIIDDAPDLKDMQDFFDKNGAT
eukprot:CAMPEP_0114602026 /NCGR_PEP_ID=MMETSP0125-20121206/24658_1 /TAXON_ID=485358 ORGANISM="Aristerostoma sp., Strain ATCC 50986" /NCGR_SAMPLE_ID=MMETSP0125 /ASSEMBLY_ACC=CAM_ASM_000245 /LENGTH=33 /DNA_ID= /DNA_START= /DNA_END= /DNA_ORIENTATION=